MQTILEEVKVTFPEFEIFEEMDGLPTVAFSFLTRFLEESIKNKNSDIIDRFVDFVNELSISDDIVVIACLSEIHLGLYCSSKIDYKEFKSLLSEHAQSSFQRGIDLWNSQNKK